MPLPASVMVRLESRPARRSSAWPRSRSRSIAGRETMSADSRQLERGLGGGLAATGNYPGKARTPDELRSDADEGAVAHSRHGIASTCTRSTASSAASASIATRSVPSTSRAGSTGRSGSASAWISIRRSSPIRSAADNFTLSHPRQGRSASSGSSTASPAAGSARRSAERWRRPASPTCGFPTA